MVLLPKTWETSRLIVSLVKIEEANLLQEIYEESFNKNWIPKDAIPTKDQMKIWISNPNLPPNGKKEYQIYQSIKEKNSNKIIGYFTGYHGYPTPQVFAIGDLFLANNAQSKGLGSEFIEQLSKILEPNYSAMQVCVRLKNWKGINFWHKQQFNKIIGIIGDKEYSENSVADILLRRELSNRHFQ